MRASLDTNVIIHFYKAGIQNVLFDFFDEGVIIYEQIRFVELKHHGEDILILVDAISLAQTLGVHSLVTDDTKQGGPYMSLLQLDYKIMPFNFADVLILRYLMGVVDEHQTMHDFELINDESQLRWSLKSQVTKFIKRFFKEPYREEEREWIQGIIAEHGIKVTNKFRSLRKLL